MLNKVVKRNGRDKMINIKEFNGNLVKKQLNAHRAGFRWHNKNKSGGNFGINIYFAEQFNRETDKEFTGYYNTDGVIYNLSFSALYSAGGNIPIWALKDIPTLFNYVKQVIGWEKGLNSSPEIKESELLSRKEQWELIKNNEVTI